MRKITFRAWDKTEAHFVYFELFQGANNHTPAIYDEAELEPWEQFTGLVDKNGAEIYEGDLIFSIEKDELYRVDPLFPVHRHTHVTNVAWKDKDGFHLRYNPAGQYDNGDDWMSWPEMYEVIGNVYENPELLKH